MTIWPLSTAKGHGYSGRSAVWDSTFGWQVTLVRNHSLSISCLSPHFGIWAITHLVKSSKYVTLGTVRKRSRDAECKLAATVYIWSVVDPKVNSIPQTMHNRGVFLLLKKKKKKRFDLFITWAVAANGGLLEEVGAVWSGGSDTGVSFITVGHSLGALMEIIMHVHNCPKAKGPGPVCMPSSMQFCGVTAFRCEVCWIWQPLCQYRDSYFTHPVCQSPNFDFLP